MVVAWTPTDAITTANGVAIIVIVDQYQNENFPPKVKYIKKLNPKGTNNPNHRKRNPNVSVSWRKVRGELSVGYWWSSSHPLRPGSQ